MAEEKQFPYSYSHPRPMVTVDAVLLAPARGGTQVLLVRRGRPPFEGCWALPGGFVEMGEDLDAAAARELLEETGVSGVALRQLRAFGAPDRDPRGRTISIAYIGFPPAPAPVRAGDDAASAGWFPVENLPALAFDHLKIVEYALGQSQQEVFSADH